MYDSRVSRPGMKNLAFAFSGFTPDDVHLTQGELDPSRDEFCKKDTTLAVYCI